MNLWRCFLIAGHMSDRVAILILTSWISASILWIELGGFPYLYGWPFVVVRLGGFDQPPIWVWIADALAACGSLTATGRVATWCCRATTRGYQFRLSTLLGAATTIAVIAAVWRWSADHLGDVTISFARQRDDEIGPSAMLDLTAFMFHWPRWMRPMQLLVRFGAVAGLGCAIYVAGSLLRRLARNLSSHWQRNDTNAICNGQ